MSSMLVPHAPTSASVVRHRFVDELRVRGVEDQVIDDAALVISELIGNAVRHGRSFDDGCIKITWHVHDAVVRIEVSEGGHGPLRHEMTRPPVKPGSADAESGRGLAIVSLLTASWGSAFDGSEATVWADVALVQSAEIEAELDAEADAERRQEA